MADNACQVGKDRTNKRERGFWRAPPKLPSAELCRHSAGRDMISLDGYRRRWQEREAYASTADWLRSVYSRWLRRVRLPMPGRGRVCSISLKADKHPFYFRLGSTDLLVLEEIFLKDEYAMVKNGRFTCPRTIVDLGANVGYSVRFWLQTYPGVRVIAVEPDSDNADLCRKNCEACGMGEQVKVIQACVRAFNGETFLDTGRDAWAYASRDTPGAGAVQVPALTLDRICEIGEMDGGVDLLKCDIEGGERELFATPGRWLSSTGAIVVEVHPPYTLSHLEHDLSNAGSRHAIIARGKTELVALFAANAVNR